MNQNYYEMGMDELELAYQEEGGEEEFGSFEDFLENKRLI